MFETIVLAVVLVAQLLATAIVVGMGLAFADLVAAIRQLQADQAEQEALMKPREASGAEVFDV